MNFYDMYQKIQDMLAMIETALISGGRIEDGDGWAQCISELRIGASKLVPTKFRIGDHVWKCTGDYNGPGVVMGMCHVRPELLTDYNQEAAKYWRYMVRHKIEGGEGFLLHIYSENNLELDVE